MSLVLDHLFILVSPGAPEAERLVTFGLIEGAANVHPGQGTACRRFFFSNAYLELLWVSDATEVQSDLVRPVHLWERWDQRTGAACPFGLIFRSGNGPESAVAFRTFDYRPPYLPSTLSLAVGRNADILTEPLLISFSFAQREQADRPRAVERLAPEHAAGLRSVTRLRIVGPRTAALSPECQGVADAGLAAIERGAEHLVEIGFDGEARGERSDFRPELPLVICW
jgi:hypothetical protein